MGQTCSKHVRLKKPSHTRSLELTRKEESALRWPQNLELDGGKGLGWEEEAAVSSRFGFAHDGSFCLECPSHPYCLAVAPHHPGRCQSGTNGSSLTSPRTPIPHSSAHLNGTDLSLAQHLAQSLFAAQMEKAPWRGVKKREEAFFTHG